MSTTTAQDLLARADRIVRELTVAVAPVDTPRWETLDTTVHRLIRECIGPGRTQPGTSSNGVPTFLLRVFRQYPTPLRPPLDTTLSAREAARYLGVFNSTTIQLATSGAIKAERHGNRFEIDSRAIDHRPDITPADAADPHPLARLATTAMRRKLEAGLNRGWTRPLPADVVLSKTPKPATATLPPDATSAMTVCTKASKASAALSWLPRRFASSATTSASSTSLFSSPRG